MYNMQVDSSGGGVGEIGGFQGHGGIYLLPVAVRHGLGGVAAPNAAYVAWAAQQGQLVELVV